MKSDVLSLVGTLSNGMADQAVISGIYDDIIRSWASLNILTTADLQPLQAGGTALQNLAPNMLSVSMFIWNNRELKLLELREAESIDPGWRNRIGIPNSFIIETEQSRTLRLYPAPAISTNPDNPVYGEPMGRDYPAYSTVLIGAESRIDVPVQYELPLALLILGREMSRESDHTDLDMAARATLMGQTLLSMARGLPPI